MSAWTMQMSSRSTLIQANDRLVSFQHLDSAFYSLQAMASIASESTLHETDNLLVPFLLFSYAHSVFRSFLSFNVWVYTHRQLPSLWFSACLGWYGDREVYNLKDQLATVAPEILNEADWVAEHYKKPFIKVIGWEFLMYGSSTQKILKRYKLKNIFTTMGFQKYPQYEHWQRASDKIACALD